MRVLLVDDAEEIRALERFVLRDDHFEVVGEAANAADATDRARALQPDAIVIDLRMPDGSGLDALPYVAAAAPKARIVVYSALVTPVIEARLRAAGVDAIVHKGEGPDRLVAALDPPA